MMINYATPIAPAQRPSATVSEHYEEEWLNGVHHAHDGKVDRYELPTAHPGVPRTIEVRHRFLLPAKASATDADGRQLDASYSGGGCCSYGPMIRVSDPKGTSLSTTIDLADTSVHVTAPLRVADVSYGHGVERCAGKQDLEPDGSSVFSVDLRQEYQYHFEQGGFAGRGRVSQVATDLVRTETDAFFSGYNGKRAPHAASMRLDHEEWSGQPRDMGPVDERGCFTITDPATQRSEGLQLYLIPKSAFNK